MYFVTCDISVISVISIAFLLLATLPQKLQNDFIKKIRNDEVLENKQAYSWISLQSPEQTGWGLPRFVNAEKYGDLPPLFKNTIAREFHSAQSNFGALYNAVMGEVQGKTNVKRMLHFFRHMHCAYYL